jgi:hypothetical protein
MAEVSRGDQVNRKEDTRVLIEVGVSKTVDLGNRLTNLTASASWAYETGNDRTELSVFEVSVQFDADTGSGGYLAASADISLSGSYFRSLVGSGATNDVRFWVGPSGGDVIIADLSLPNLGASLRTYTIQWCCRANPLTTGASDAQESWIEIIDHDTANSYAIYRLTHAQINPTISNTHMFALGMRWNGAAEIGIYTDTIAWVRVGSRFHSTTEGAGDWKETFAAPSNSGQDYVQQAPMPTRAGIEDEFAGPQLLYADIAHKKNAMRLLSPLVNEAYIAPVTLTDNITDDVDAALVITDPDDSEYQLHEGFLRRRICPSTFNKIYIRVSAQLWAAAGGPDQLEVRCYSSNHWPGNPVDDPVTKFITLTFTDDDTSSGPPTWKSGELPVVRDDDNWTHLWLGFSTNNGSASANNRYKIWAFTVDPIVVPIGSSEEEGGVVLPP